MFLHEFKYQILQTFRNTGELFWVIVFPIVLGTFFQIAFGSIYENTELFSAIPVAVVSDGSENADAFLSLTQELSKGEDALLNVKTTSEEEALALLEDNELCGIFYAQEEVSLTVPQDFSKSDTSISYSILQLFLKQYNTSKDAILSVAATHPERLGDTLSALSSDNTYVKELSFGTGDMNVYNQYFYNLIAMVCLYTSLAGCTLAVQNQGNLSHIGMRKGVSPMHKLKTIAAGLISNIFFQFLCILVSFAYLVFVLGVNFGSQIPLLLLAIFISCINGVCFGFFLGSIGHIEERIKHVILLCFTLFGCFLSGLMVGNMKLLVEQYCPILNRINPAALISDSFYALCVYTTHTKYMTNMATLLVFSIIFIIGGFLIVRRDKYASV